MSITFTDLPAQYAEIAYDVEPDLLDCLRQCAFTGGHYLERFERNLCNYLGINHAIGVSNGTDAIMLTCEVLRISDGDYVLVPNNAPVAVAHGISRSGATPLFTDCDPDTFLMDANHVEKLLQSHIKRKRIKAILIVDLYGQLPDMEQFCEIAQKYKVYLIEDAAQALGSTQRGRHVGFYPDVATLSFGPNKPLGGIGQGGAIITNDTITAKKIRFITNQGYEKELQYVLLGGNYRLDAIKALQLYHALKHLDNWNDRRRMIAKIYNDGFTSEQRPTQQPCTKHIYHLYEFKCRHGLERDRLERELLQNHIGYRLHPYLISDTPMYEGTYDTPTADDLQDRIISLPIHPWMNDEDAQIVVDVVNGCCT